MNFAVLKLTHMLTLRISPEDLEKAKVEKSEHIVAKIRNRMWILWLLGTGRSRSEVCELTGQSSKTVRRCIQMYQASGLEGVRSLRYRGPKSVLEGHRSSLEASFEGDPPRSSKEAADRVEQLTGVKLSAGRVMAFMKRIGMKCRKMGHVPAKADAAKQRHFYEQTLRPLMEGAKNGACRLFFMDASHFTLSPFVCMVWCFARVFLKAAAGRNRINVLGAICASGHQLETVINTTYITSGQVVEMLQKLALKYGALPIYVVLDNARYQHCDLVRQQALALNIHLVFLPAYSPNLNIIERLWKLIREKTLNGKYYPNAELFHKAIFSAVDSVNHDQQWKKDVASRLSQNIQFFDVPVLAN
jgi:transposase